MFDLSLHQLHELLGGRLRMATLAPHAGEATRIGPAAIDSRRVQDNDVFWALVGPTRDGAQFADEAYRSGASGVIASRYVQPWPGCWSLEIDDPQRSLTTLAAWVRDQFPGEVIGVTGSVGKTTTRHMIHRVLSTRQQGATSPQNYNNHLGVPLSILSLEPAHQFAVLELAASDVGEIASLARLCKPHVGVITRIGEAHLGGFGSQKRLSAAKAELLDYLDGQGCMVLNADDHELRKIAAGFRGQIIWVGRSADADIRATEISSRGGELSFTVEGSRLHISVWGRHHLTGALAAVAVGKYCGYPMADIARGLAQFRSPSLRCEVVEAAGATIINDTYNASPTAMRAALELLRDFDAPGRRIVVCGDMRELGDAAQSMHHELGDDVVTLCGADLLLACGDHASDVVDGARRAGMSPTKTIACEQPDEALEYVRSAIEPGDVILFKGSRALAMERLVEKLQHHLGPAQPQAA